MSIVWIDCSQCGESYPHHWRHRCDPKRLRTRTRRMYREQRDELLRQQRKLRREPREDA